MEGCWTVSVSSELASAFPTLLELSAEEIVAVWDAVSQYILEQMKLDKGVLVPGLGIFAGVREQFHSKEEVLSVRRPVFELNIRVLWLPDLQSPSDIIPDSVKIEPLNYRQLSRASGVPLHLVLRCVRESVLLYCHLLRNKTPVPFVFKNLGVMTCQDNFLCMRFFCTCVETLESNAPVLALIHTRFWTEDLADFGPEISARGIRVFPRFQLTMEKSRAEAAADKKSAIERKLSRGVSASRLLPRRKTLTPPMLQREPGSRQQELAKEPSASALPLCAGSFRRTKKGEQKEASTAQTSAALPATEESKRVLQELRKVSALWKEADHTWPMHQQQIEQARAEMAAWEGWSAGKDQRPPQLLARESVCVPHPPAQPRGQKEGRRWRKDVDPVPASKMGTATKLALHADLLSPRAAQVLQKLEPHLHQQEAFAGTAERNRQKLELKRQFPRARCSHRSREEGAANGGNRGGAVGQGAGKPSRFPPVNGRS
ncbi:coiled-coil domain-containing protein 81-like [Centrocercus urophasianus]|uniref:coiled-coil domain-containing protein 81-like n=1 Tax=Centrocercus urophasianus TaxID=9002 RepID=UPI001C651FE5|nr:coiled-coil domain-containing protein 81-like [Centrocercus urophasianus]